MIWTDEEHELLTRLGFTKSDMNAARYARLGVPGCRDAFFTHTVKGYEIRAWPIYAEVGIRGSKVSEFTNIGAIPLLAWAVIEGLI